MSGMDEQQQKINESMAQAPSRAMEASAAALLKLLEYNIPADTLELLMHGSKRANVRPGALVAALSVAIGTYNRL